MREWSIDKAVFCCYAGLVFLLLRFCYTAFTSPVLHSNDDVVAVYSWIVMLASNGVMQLLIVAYARKGRRLLGDAFPFMMCLCALSSVGMLAMYVGFDAFGSSAISYGGAIMTAFGAAALPPCWKETSACLATKRAQMLVCFLSVLTAGMLYLLCLSLPSLVAVALNSLAPIMSIGFLRQAFLSKSDEVRCDVSGTRERSGATDRSRAMRAICALFAYGFILSVPQSFWKMDLLPFVNGEGFSWSFMVAGSVVLVGLCGVVDCALRASGGDGRIADGVLFVETLAVMLLPLFFEGNQAVFNVGVCAGLFLYWVVFYSEIDEVPVREDGGVWLYALCILVSDFSMVAVVLVVPAVAAAISLRLIGVCIAILSVTAFFFRSGTRDLMPMRFLPVSDRPSRANAESGDMRMGISKQCDCAAEVYQLSEREREVLERLVLGRSAKTISGELFISYNTVKTYMNRIYKKLDVHTREELIRSVEDLREPR